MDLLDLRPVHCQEWQECKQCDDNHNNAPICPPSIPLRSHVSDLPLRSLDDRAKKDLSLPFNRLAELPPPGDSPSSSQFVVILECAECRIRRRQGDRGDSDIDVASIFNVEKYPNLQLHTLCDNQPIFPPRHNALITAFQTHRRQGEPESPRCILDCGSGYSRLSKFVMSPTTNRIQSTQPSANLPAIHKVLPDPAASKSWLSDLGGLLTTVGCKKVFIGATAGVRDSIANGSVAEEDVDRFRSMLPSLNFSAELSILSGEEEAEYEFISAKYCAELCGFCTKDDDVGLLSSGGMSSQVAWKTVTMSLPTAVKSGNAMGLKFGMEDAVEKYRVQVTTSILDSGIGTDFGGDETIWLAIEMLAAAGEAAGIGGCVMGVAEAGNVLNEFVVSSVKLDGERPEDFQRDWRTYVKVMSAVMGVALLSRLRQSSRILFSRQFAIRPEELLKPSWSLGIAVSRLMKGRPSLGQFSLSPPSTRLWRPDSYIENHLFPVIMSKITPEFTPRKHRNLVISRRLQSDIHFLVTVGTEIHDTAREPSVCWEELDVSDKVGFMLDAEGALESWGNGEKPDKMPEKEGHCGPFEVVRRMIGEVTDDGMYGGSQFGVDDEEGREQKNTRDEKAARINVIDLGSGGGRDISFLAESISEYVSTLPLPLPPSYRLYGIDYHPGSPKRCIPFWGRRGVGDITEHVGIDLKDVDKFEDWRRCVLTNGDGRNGFKSELEGGGARWDVYISVRYLNRDVLDAISSSPPDAISSSPRSGSRGEIVCISHFCTLADGTYPFSNPSKISDVAKRGELEEIFTEEKGWEIISIQYKKEMGKGRPMIGFMAQRRM